MQNFLPGTTGGPPKSCTRQHVSPSWECGARGILPSLDAAVSGFTFAETVGIIA